MCYSPLRIKNPIKYFNPTLDKVELTVPCNHCGECLNTKQNEWLVRSYWEFQQVKDSKGCMLFTTLTYNNQSLPKVQGTPCFSKRDVQLFLKRLRSKIYRYYINKFSKEKYVHTYHKAPNTKKEYLHILTPDERKQISNKYRVRYFITTEYGNNDIYIKNGLFHRGSTRPHYHALISFTWDVNPITAKHFIRQTWDYDMNKGFVHFGKFGKEVQDSRALYYVAKYITKDYEVVEKLKELIDFEDNETLLDKLPFHLQSIGFGAYALKKADKTLLESLQINYYHSKYGLKTIPLPVYYLRKLLYTTTPDNSYVLTSYGKSILKRNFDNKLYQLNKRLLDQYNSIKFLDQKIIHELNVHFGYDFSSPNDIYKFINKQIDDDFTGLTYYILNFKDRVSMPPFKRAYDYSLLKRTINTYKSFNNTAYGKIEKTFNYSKKLSPYELVIRLLTDIRKNIGLKKQILYEYNKQIKKDQQWLQI